MKIVGTSASEALTGTSGDDDIQDNLGGDDVINAGEGDDTILVGRGWNAVAGGSVTVDAGPGNDTFSYSGIYTNPSVTLQVSLGDGADLASIQDSAHVIVDAGAGDDLIALSMTTTRPEQDYLIRTGSGRDTIRFGSGADSVLSLPDFTPGEDRLDLFYLIRHAANTIAGANPFATGHLALGSSALGVDLLFDADGGGDRYVTIAQMPGDVGAYTSVELGWNPSGGATAGLVFAGSADRDFATGTAGADTIRGAAGDDLLWGHAGDDVLEGGAGMDFLTGDPGDDFIDGGAGDDIATFSASLDKAMIGALASGVRVTSVEGVDVLVSIETLQFSGNVLKIDGLAQIAGLYEEFFGRDVVGTEALVWQDAFAHGSTPASLRSTLVSTDVGRAYIASQVDGLYRDYFGRAAGGPEVTVWTNAIAGGASYGDVRTALVSTAYGQAHIGAVTTDIYQTFFGRAPSAPELMFWTEKVVSGASFEDVRGVLGGHPYGQAHVATETTALYEAYFGRPAAASEIQFWTDALVHGASYRDIRTALVSTDYGKAHIAAETNTLYETYFGRAATAGEQAFWTNAVVQGSSFADLRAVLVTHPYGQAHIADEVADLYQTYFGRSPAGAELQVWKDAIVSGSDFNTLTDALMSYGASLGVQHLSATASADHFVFNAAAPDTVIQGFQPGHDIIELQGLGSNPLGHAQAVPGYNDVLLDYGPDLAILLKGVTLADLHTSDFLPA
jgi:Ca2+-binding RTX toxin-like protein